MKVLIPYDGSSNARIALEALHAPEFAGQRLDVLILITDVWLPETTEDFFFVRADRKNRMELSGICSYVPASRNREEMLFLAREIRRQTESLTDQWNIRLENAEGFSLVSSEVLERAETWKADLIILGTQNGGSAGARRVAAKAKCRVRMVGGLKPTGTANRLPKQISRLLESVRFNAAEEIKTISELKLPDRTKTAAAG